MTFNEFLEIMASVETVDGWGQPVNSWEVTGTIYGRVRTERGEEFVSDSQADTMRKAIAVTTYWRGDLKSSDRLIWQGETYEIVGLVPNKRKNELLINAVFTEGVG